MLANEVDYVVGVDTHKQTNTAVAVNSLTAEPAPPLTAASDPDGHWALVDYADAHAPGARVWAIESTAHYGASLTAYLHQRGERVVEVDRPKRPRGRDGAKSDELDAARAAKEVLGRKHQSKPRSRGQRGALRVLQRTRQQAVAHRAAAISSLRAMVVSAPEALRQRLRGLGRAELVGRCARMRLSGDVEVELAMTKLAMRSIARRIQQLGSEVEALGREIQLLVIRLCPALLEQPGIGPITAAELILGFSHRGRLRSEAAFASLAGVAPIPASSGKTVRHRLNRGGDRRLNRAIDTVALVRIRGDARTRDYVGRRLAQGKSEREIKRCLKRYLARSLFRLMEAEMAA